MKGAVIVEEERESKSKGAVIVEEERESKSMWKVGIVEELFQGKYGQIGGAKLWIPKMNSNLKRSVNKLYIVERMNEILHLQMADQGERQGRSNKSSIHETYVDIFFVGGSV